MDPMNRKLFKSRDARTKLRDMGGIMASSPELARTVQTFNVGGRVTGLEQMEADPIRDGRATRIGSKTFVMLPSGVVLDARTQAPASAEETLAVQRKLNAFPQRDPIMTGEETGVNPSYATDMRDRNFGIGVSDRMSDIPSVEATPRIPSPLSSPPSDVSTLRTAPNLRAPQGVEDPFSYGSEFAGMSDSRLEAERLAAESGGLKEFGIDIAEGLTGAVRGAGSALQRGIGTGASMLGMPGVGEFFLEGAESTDELSRRRAQEERDREAARAARVAEIDETQGVTRGEPLQIPDEGVAALLPPKAETEDDTTPPPPPLPAPVRAPDEIDGGAETTVPDFDTSYEQALERLGGVLGKGADEDKKKKAMANMAMIGLAIASGQSPNALTNIAQGALAGMQGIQKAEAADEAMQRELELAAIEMAQEDVQLNKRLASAEKIAGMRAAEDGVGTYTPERLYQTNLNAILSNPDAFDVYTGKVVDPAKARAAAQALSRRGVDASLTTGGRIVEQNGIRYQEQADGTFTELG